MQNRIKARREKSKARHELKRKERQRIEKNKRRLWNESGTDTLDSKKKMVRDEKLAKAPITGPAKKPRFNWWRRVKK